MKSTLRDNITAGNAVLYFLGAAVAVALKYHYSRATADELLWILYPVSVLVKLMTGIGFEREAEAGLINYSHGIAIAPACGGVNFLIIAFCTALFPLGYKMRSWKAKGFWFGIALASSYLLTLFVNSLRIVLSIFLVENRVHYGWFTPERVHRIEGVVVYFFFLVIFYVIMKRAAAIVETSGRIRDTGSENQKNHLPFAPLFWYSLIVLAVPILNGSYRQEGVRFAEHFWTVGLSCVSVFLVIHLARLYSKKIMFNIGGRIMPHTKGSKGVRY